MSWRFGLSVCFPLLLIGAFPGEIRAQTTQSSSTPIQQRDPAVEARLDQAVEHFGFDTRLRNVSSYPQWVPGVGQLIYWSRPNGDDGHWVRVDAASGARTVLIAPMELRARLATLTGQDAPLPPYVQFAIAPDGHALNFTYQGKGYSLDLDTKAISPLADQSLARLALDAPMEIAPRGARAARGTARGVEVLDASGRATSTFLDEDHYAWTLPDGAWSPDGESLILWRTDARQVHRIPIVENDGPMERVRYVPYAKSGTAIERAELHLVDAHTGGSRQIRVTDAEGYSFLAGWRKDGSEAYVLHLSRDGKRLDLYGVAPGSGQVRLIVREERPETSIGDLGFITDGWQRQITPLDDGFLWMSERDGWRHVYRYDHAGRLRGRVTSGSFPVHEVASVSRDGRFLLLLASADPAHPYDRLPYRVAMTGGRVIPLSRERGIHRLYPDPGGDYFADAFSNLTQPTTREVISLDGRVRHRYDMQDASALTAWGYRPPEAFVATAADGRTPLHGVLYRPRDFDPAKRYAVVNYVYGGPFTVSTQHNFFGNMDSRLAAALAQAGFVVVFVDGRGTPGRSKAFQDATYGRIGQMEIADQVAVIRQVAASRPYMDLTRTGIAGYSWGGYFALRGMLTAPDFYRAGYAGAPGDVTEMAMVNEPNLGLPADNPAGYQAASNVAAAGQLRGALRLVHGTSDVDAPLSTTLRMADALIKADKRFELFLFPGGGHSPAGDVRDYYIRDLALFFLRELGPPRPASVVP